MNRTFLALTSVGIVTSTLCGMWSVQAQSPSPVKLPIFIPPTPIAIPFNPASDGQTVRPKTLRQSDFPTDPNRAIIGADNRVAVNSQSFPWSAIGRLDGVGRDGNSYALCTGTLIGRDLVLTNAHCLIDDKTKQPKKVPLRFRPNLRDGRSPDSATVNVTASVYGQGYTKNDPADDWAILKIDRPLGDDYGYLGWRVLNLSDDKAISKTANQIRLVGYSDDFPADKPFSYGGVHGGCSIVRIEGVGGILAHECDSNPGSSGGPLFAFFSDGSYYIVGLNAGSNASFDRDEPTSVRQLFNRGVQVSRWAAQAAALRKGGATKAGN